MVASKHEKLNEPSELHPTHCARIGRSDGFEVNLLTAIKPHPSCHVCMEVLSKSAVIRRPQALRCDERQGHLRTACVCSAIMTATPNIAMQSFPSTTSWINSSTGRPRSSSAKHHSSSAKKPQAIGLGPQVDPRNQRYSLLPPQNFWISPREGYLKWYGRTRAIMTVAV